MAAGIPFGEYRLLERLGAGGMAEVFLARRAGPGGFSKRLVIKRILPHLSAAERFTELFLNEARLAALVDHPNLVHVSSFGEIDGQYYLAMEYVEGFTVAELLERAGRLMPGIAGRIAVDLLDALHAIHTAREENGSPVGLVHRDVSPRNAMVTRAGAVKLLDFGIAVAGDDPTRAVMGTRRYMSPEQSMGEALDGRSDLFCVGVLLYQMLTGEPPFEEGPGALPERPPEVPEALWTIVAAALSLDREARPASARQMQASIELFLSSRGMEGTRAHLADLVGAVLPDRRSTPSRVLSRITQIGPFTRKTRSVASSVSTRPEKMLALAAVLTLLGGAGWVAIELERDGRIGVEPLSAAPLAAAKTATRAAPPALEPVRADLHAGASLGAALDGQPSGEQPSIPRSGPHDGTSLGAAIDARSARDPTPTDRAPVPKRSTKRSTKRLGTGRLTIDTTPWTEVYLEDRKLGMTPLEGVRLPAGRHELRLKNGEVGLDRRVRVTIRAGKVTRIRRAL